jgi:hypothetical protein
LKMKVRHSLVAILSIVIVSLTTGCSRSGVSEHYVSPQVQGDEQKINLDEVQKAFFESKGAADFNAWMAAFEKRVNEIYDGEGVVALDATRENERLVVTGYIDKDQKPGYQSGDEKLFTMEQTGEVVNNELPYRVAGGNGTVYYEGHRSILDNPFVQMMVLSHMMNSWGGRYYTPYDRFGSLRTYQNTWRRSPQFEQQKTANKDFFSRFKTKTGGTGYQSRTSFGSSSFSGASGSQRRTWGGSSSSSGGSSGFSWGGRRSSGSIFGGSRRWGGRRR